MADSIQTEHNNTSPEQKPAGSDLSDAELLELFAGHGVYRDNAAQYRGRLDGQLLINRCADCNRYHQPPRPMCPSCWSFDVVPTPVSGRGTIHLLMHLHAGPPADGVDYQNGGHPVVVVELEEQEHLRVTGTVHGFDSNGPSIGDAVELDFLDRGGVPIVAFQPSRQTEPSHPTVPNRHAGEPNRQTGPDQPNRQDDTNRPDQPNNPDQPSEASRQTGPDQRDHQNNPNRQTGPDQPNRQDDTNRPDQPNNPDQPSEASRQTGPDRPGRADERSWD